MENINLDDFLSEGIIKEKDFRKKVSLLIGLNMKIRKLSSKGVLVQKFQHGLF
tara:strand:+ start:891 stop:1049 length:159 start_codon:yes stop_codon:yes gene_type:complete